MPYRSGLVPRQYIILEDKPMPNPALGPLGLLEEGSRLEDLILRPMSKSLHECEQNKPL